MSYPPPSHLKEFVVDTEQPVLLKIQKEYGGNTTAFRVAKQLKSLALSYNADTQEYGGRVWGVDTNGNKHLLYDQFRHGYNGAMEISEQDKIFTTKTIDLLEGADVIIALQYNGDEAEYAGDGLSEFEQDYFGWVVFYQATGDQLKEEINFECA